jgi:hypothetical protein
MSLRDLNPRTRARLRFHGWLLTLWCLALGLLTSWWLLRVLHLRAPAARYAISAVVMYAFGLVVGARYWLGRFSASVREEAGVLGRADAGERASFDAAQRTASRERERIGKKFEWGFDLLDLGGLDELAGLLLIPALVMLVLGVLMLTGTLPVILADGVAGLLAEMALQFVFSALLVRGALRPGQRDDPFLHIVGKTWIAGLLLVVASAGAGALLTRLEPGAASVGDLFRHR